MSENIPFSAEALQRAWDLAAEAALLTAFGHVTTSVAGVELYGATPLVLDDELRATLLEAFKAAVATYVDKRVAAGKAPESGRDGGIGAAIRIAADEVISAANRAAEPQEFYPSTIIHAAGCDGLCDGGCGAADALPTMLTRTRGVDNEVAGRALDAMERKLSRRPLRADSNPRGLAERTMTNMLRSAWRSEHAVSDRHAAAEYLDFLPARASAAFVGDIERGLASPVDPDGVHDWVTVWSREAARAWLLETDLGREVLYAAENRKVLVRPAVPSVLVRELRVEFVCVALVLVVLYHHAHGYAPASVLRNLEFALWPAVGADAGNGGRRHRAERAAAALRPYVLVLLGSRAIDELGA
ncbi:MAG: hypothetical protein Q8K63_14360 [Acidimicrobiales bacterium]|nr:hypothetical protein [Acidimicrobiales bacterium]